MKVAVVGTGMIVRMVGPHLASWGWEVSDVAGTSLQKAQAVTQELGGEPHVDLGRMLALTCAEVVYVATPNHLHHEHVLRCLRAGKSVIVEKPLASNAREAEDLACEARERGLFLWEATTVYHQPNFKALRELLPRIGSVRLALLNYSQYSSRYDAFRRGEVLPVFDPKKSGGALMDLGLYCLAFAVGLFGEPSGVRYEANVQRGIDTSGVVLLDYGDFKAVCACAKDSAAPLVQTIQGDDGYLSLRTPPSQVGPVTLRLNDGREETVDRNPQIQWESEFLEFAEDYAAGNAGLSRSREALELSLAVSRVQTRARQSAGIVFPAD